MNDQQKTYDSVVAGKYMMALANQMGVSLNATKLQKLLFIVYGYFLAFEGIPIVEEQPKAWPFGPVFPRVQKRVDTSLVVKLSDPDLSEIKNDDRLTAVMTGVINKYSKFSATQLSDWSHEPGSPWELTTKEEGFNWNRPIKDSHIIDYFTEFDVV